MKRQLLAVSSFAKIVLTACCWQNARLRRKDAGFCAESDGSRRKRRLTPDAVLHFVPAARRIKRLTTNNESRKSNEGKSNYAA